MSNIDRLVKLAQQYQQRAVTAQQNQSLQYVMSIVQKMVGLANGGIASVRHLLTFPQYKRSPGLSTMKDKLPTVVQMLNSYTPSNDDDAFLASLGSILDGVSFYTAKSNAGTGHDSATDVS